MAYKQAVAFTFSLGIAALFGAAAAVAQPAPNGGDNLDLTMVLLPENAAGPEEITRRIELPPATDPAAGQQPTTPNEASGGDGKDNGRDTAAEARERGREFGHEAKDDAREERENAGLGDGVPGPPQVGRDPPGRPDDPGNPDPPGRPPDPGNSNRP